MNEYLERIKKSGTFVGEFITASIYESGCVFIPCFTLK
jgi:hypothetical protein